jgi:putative protein kinase ArgK-like GTPase of G3E family
MTALLIETVGVGRDEVDDSQSGPISQIVVLVPGLLGDDIQAIKAGIMEIGDLFVINKSEREGLERTERELIGLLARWLTARTVGSLQSSERLRSGVSESSRWRDRLSGMASWSPGKEL